MAKLKAKYGKPNAESRIPKAECGKPNAESGIRKTKYGKLSTENLIRRVLKSTTCEFQNAELLKPQTKPQTKGPITWRVSARAEISARPPG